MSEAVIAGGTCSTAISEATLSKTLLAMVFDYSSNGYLHLEPKKNHNLSSFARIQNDDAI